MLSSSSAIGVEPPCAVLFTKISAAWPFSNELRGKTLDARAEWQKLRDPINTFEPRGLAYLRRTAETEGFFVVVPESSAVSNADKEFYKKLYGGRVVFAGDVPKGQSYVRYPGLAFHPGNTPDLANAARGTVNPHMGYGRLHGELDNKLSEYRFVRSVDPKAMPRSVSGGSLITEENKATYIALRDDARKVLRKLMDNPESRLATEERQKFLSLVSFYLGEVENKFPKGAFLKHIDESMGLEAGGMVATIHRKDDKWLRQFSADLNWVRYYTEKGVRRFTDPRVERKIAAYDDATNATRFIQALLYDPDKLIVQAAMNPGKTPLGKIKEFRVNFIQGSPVNAMARESWEWLPDDEAKAMKFVSDFFKKAPRKYKYLSGGADVMIQKDGSVKFVELNLGAQAGDFDPWWAPVFGNSYMSAVLGKPTLIVQELESVFTKPFSEQMQFMNGLERKGSVYIYSSEEVYHWLTKRYLQEWTTHPNKKSADEMLKKLWELKGILNRAKYVYPEDAREIYKAAESFVNTRLATPSP